MDQFQKIRVDHIRKIMGGSLFWIKWITFKLTITFFFVGYIQENYSKELSLQEIAKQIYLSPDYFSRLFKREVGYTYTEYLTKIRIEAAKELLANPGLSVAEVAKKVGWKDPNYFSHVFRKIVGLSPTGYKQTLGVEF